MKRLFAVLMSLALSSMFGSRALADDDPAECAATIKLFQDAGESASYVKNSYGYAVFPTIGKAGLGVGGAHGSGCVYEKGVASFSIIKGGLMYEAALAGAKFKYKPL